MREFICAITVFCIMEFCFVRTFMLNLVLTRRWYQYSGISGGLFTCIPEFGPRLPIYGVGGLNPLAFIAASGTVC